MANIFGIPRESIPWFPTFDYEKCTGCQECYNFCKHDVFRWDEEQNHPVLENPFNCVIGCSACANACEAEAISFPSREELASMLARKK